MHCFKLLQHYYGNNHIVVVHKLFDLGASNDALQQSTAIGNKIAVLKETLAGQIKARQRNAPSSWLKSQFQLQLCLHLRVRLQSGSSLITAAAAASATALVQAQVQLIQALFNIPGTINYAIELSQARNRNHDRSFFPLFVWVFFLLFVLLFCCLFAVFC